MPKRSAPFHLNIISPVILLMNVMLAHHPGSSIHFLAFGNTNAGGYHVAALHIVTHLTEKSENCDASNTFALFFVTEYLYIGFLIRKRRQISPYRVGHMTWQ